MAPFFFLKWIQMQAIITSCKKKKKPKERKEKKRTEEAWLEASFSFLTLVAWPCRLKSTNPTKCLTLRWPPPAQPTLVKGWGQGWGQEGDILPLSWRWRGAGGQEESLQGLQVLFSLLLHPPGASQNWKFVNPAVPSASSKGRAPNPPRGWMRPAKKCQAGGDSSFPHRKLDLSFGEKSGGKNCLQLFHMA